MSFKSRSSIVSISISALALIISARSCQQANRALDINIISSSAKVKVTKLVLLEDPKKSSFLKFNLNLTNFGKIPAKVVSSELAWEVSDFEIPLEKLEALTMHDLDLAQNGSAVLRIQSSHLFSGGNGRAGARDLNGPKSKLLIYGITHYNDVLSKEKSRDTWCFIYDPSDKGQFSLSELRTCKYNPKK